MIEGIFGYIVIAVIVLIAYTIGFAKGEERD